MRVRKNCGWSILSIAALALLTPIGGEAQAKEIVVAKLNAADSLNALALREATKGIRPQGAKEVEETATPPPPTEGHGRGLEIIFKANADANPIVVLEGGSSFLSCEPTGGSGTYVSFAWTGPDDFTSNVQNPGLVTPEDSGNHVYQVVVTDSDGSSVTGTAQIYVPDQDEILSEDKNRNLSRVSYRVSNKSYPGNPKDTFKLVLGLTEDMPIEAGDKIALEINGINIGDLNRGEGLTLGGKRRISGPIGEAPYEFTHSRIRFWEKKDRRLPLLVMRFRRGVAELPDGFVILENSGIAQNILIAVIIDRASSDGVIDAVIAAEIPFKVEVQRRIDERIETGRWHTVDVGR